jgi:hypothetical protein
VTVDGDVDPTPVHDITHLGAPAGTRVTVLFAPPHQALMIGLPQHESWFLVGSGGIAAPFSAGWGNDPSTGNLDDDLPAKVMYRKYGNLVEVRGRALRTSGVGSQITILPIGYQPRNRVLFYQSGAFTTAATIQVSRHGGVDAIAGAPGPIDIALMFTTT